MKVKEIKKIAKKDIVIPDYLIRPLEDKENDEIKELSELIDNTVMINEIDVRILENGKFELMAGARRFQAVKDDELFAKIFEDTDIIDAMIINLTENNSRKNLDINTRDDYIFKLWKKAKEFGKVKSMKEFAIKIGMKENTVNIIIQAGEEKNNPETRNSYAIKKATARDLYKTKDLRDYPDIRNKLLAYEQEGKIHVSYLNILSVNLKQKLDNGEDTESIKDLIEKLAGSESAKLQNPNDDDGKNKVIKVIPLGESSAFCAKEIPKKDKVINGTIGDNLDTSSEFKEVHPCELSASYTKAVSKKEKVLNGTIDDSKNDVSELKMSQNGVSPQKNFDRKKAINSKKIIDKEKFLIKDLWYKIADIDTEKILNYRDSQLIDDYSKYLKKVIDHLMIERAKILLSRAEFVSEK